MDNYSVKMSPTLIVAVLGFTMVVAVLAFQPLRDKFKSNGVVLCSQDDGKTAIQVTCACG